MAYVLILEHSFVKVLEQMSMINIMNYFLSTAAEGFVPSHAPLKNNKHLNIPFSVNSAEERKRQVRITRPNSFIPGPCLRRGVWGHASILSVMSNVALDSFHHCAFSSRQKYNDISFVDSSDPHSCPSHFHF